MMTEPQRIERARLAKLAMEEFLEPAFTAVSVEYERRMRAICASKPWATNEIAALANAGRIVEEVRGQIKGLIEDGKEALANQNHARRVEDLSPAKKRLLGV